MAAVRHTALLLGISLCATLSGAQQVGYKDASPPAIVLSPTVSKEEKENLQEECNGKGGVGYQNGITNSEGGPGRISIKILSLDKNRFSANETLFLIARLKNTGEKPITIPWNTDIRISWQGQDVHDRNWKFASFRAQLVGKDRHATELVNNSLGLYGSASVPDSMFTIQPGEWIVLKFQVLIRLAHPEFEKLNKGTQQLELTWFQTNRTRKLEGCNLTLGYFPYDFRQRTTPIRITLK